MNNSLLRVEKIVPGLRTEGLLPIEDILSRKLMVLNGEDPKDPDLMEMAKSRFQYSLPFGKPNNCCYAYFPLVDGVDSDIIRLFSDQVVVDLGAGEFPHAYQIIKICGARAYIGVEPYYADRLAARLEEDWLKTGLEQELEWMNTRSEYRGVNPEIARSVVCDDMLTFLRRLPSSSVSVFTNAIDEFIIDEDYAGLVDEEILRVLHPCGGLFCGSPRFRFYQRDGKNIYQTSSLKR